MALLPLLLALALPDLVDQVAPSVVNVASTFRVQTAPWGQYTENEIVGSGIMGEVPGTVLTNSHLVAGAHEVYITLADARLYRAEVVGFDPILDVAVLRVPGEAWTPPAPFRDLAAEPLRRGEDLFAVGNPYGLEASVSRGIVSATDRLLETAGGVRWGLLQTDMAINPGNSGGPMVDAKGRVVALASGRITGDGTEGLGFGIPIGKVRLWTNRILEGDRGHAWLGALVQEVRLDPETAANLGLPRRGLFVRDALLPGGPREGDILLAVDGTPVVSLAAAFELVDSRRPGELVSLTVWRGREGARLTVTVRALERVEGYLSL